METISVPCDHHMNILPDNQKQNDLINMALPDFVDALQFWMEREEMCVSLSINMLGKQKERRRGVRPWEVRSKRQQMENQTQKVRERVSCPRISLLLIWEQFFLGLECIPTSHQILLPCLELMSTSTVLNLQRWRPVAAG